MEHNIKSDRLIIPIYINEKIVLDMLAIMEDGFSMVSQINYTEHKENSSSQKIDAGISTSASILSKLLKIDVSGGISHEGNKGENESIVKEKIHTNVSLLSKFRGFLVQQKILKSDFDFLKMQVGDFIEVEGELQKNPIINYMDSFIDLFRMANIFAEQPQVGGKTQAKNQKKKDDEMVKQIKLFEKFWWVEINVDKYQGDNDKKYNKTDYAEVTYAYKSKALIWNPAPAMMDRRNRKNQEKQILREKYNINI